jgi:hypothetical protein
MNFDRATDEDGVVRIVIEGHDLPGRRFNSAGVRMENVHVGVQLGKQPVGLVRGDITSARWEVDVVPVVDDDGTVDLRGPAVQGKRGERFLYLTWGDVRSDGSFAMFRRAKVMVSDIDPGLLEAAVESDGQLVAVISLTDDRGGPVCARVRPPAIRWRAA